MSNPEAPNALMQRGVTMHVTYVLHNAFGDTCDTPRAVPVCASDITTRPFDDPEPRKRELFLTLTNLIEPEGLYS